MQDSAVEEEGVGLVGDVVRNVWAWICLSCDMSVHSFSRRRRWAWWWVRESPLLVLERGR